MVNSLTDVEFPPCYCPLESRSHSRAQLIEDRAAQWIRDSGMCAGESEYKRVLASRAVDFFGRFAPSADDDRLLATALWVYWGFGFDDARCDDGPLRSRPAEFNALAGRVQRALEAPSARDEHERYVPPLQEIAGRFRSLGTALQFRRFSVAHRAWLSGVCWEVGNNARGRMPSLDEYLALRLLSSGGEPTFAMLELATGVQVEAAEMDRPGVRALTEMAVLVAALDNDRHSLRRENAEEMNVNIYSVLMREERATLAEAVRAATGLRDRVLTRFLTLYEQMQVRASTELKTYLRGLCHGIRGNAEWGMRVPRYLDAGSYQVPGEEDSSMWAEAPADNSTGPLPAPSVAWWWEDLAQHIT